MLFWAYCCTVHHGLWTITGGSRGRKDRILQGIKGGIPKRNIYKLSYDKLFIRKHKYSDNHTHILILRLVHNWYFGNIGDHSCVNKLKHL